MGEQGAKPPVIPPADPPTQPEVRAEDDHSEPGSRDDHAGSSGDEAQQEPASATEIADEAGDDHAPGHEGGDDASTEGEAAGNAEAVEEPLSEAEADWDDEAEGEWDGDGDDEWDDDAEGEWDDDVEGEWDEEAEGEWEDEPEGDDEQASGAGVEEDEPDEESGEPRPSRRARVLTRLLATATFGIAGFLAVASGVNAQGTDLRAERQTDIADLARAQVQHNRALDAELSKLRNDVDKILERQLGNGDAGEAQRRADRLAPSAGLTAVAGPGVRVVLDDAPVNSRPTDADPDALVVHQQDIQGVVNALWAGGAEAMTLQGQRIISTTAVRCVGNTVRVNGLPYSPPYSIEAIGPSGRMVKALGQSRAVDTYRDYAAVYGLGWQLNTLPQVSVPAFDGSLSLDYAEEWKSSSGSDGGESDTDGGED